MARSFSTQISGDQVLLESNSGVSTKDGGLTTSATGGLKVNYSVVAHHSTLVQAVADEASSRGTAISTLQSALDAEVSALGADIAGETTSRSTAVSTIYSLFASANIEEATTRSTADSVLQSAIDATSAAAVESSLNAEISTRTIAVSTLQSAIDQEIADRQAEVTDVNTIVDGYGLRLDAIEGGLTTGVQFKGVVSGASESAIASAIVSAIQAEPYMTVTISGGTLTVTNPSTTLEVSPVGWTYYDTTGADTYVLVEGGSDATLGRIALPTITSHSVVKYANFKELESQALSAANSVFDAVDLSISTVQSALDAEIALTDTDISTIYSLFASANIEEATTRSTADSALQSALDAEIASTDADISTIFSAFASANIETVSQFEAADSAIYDMLNSVGGSITDDAKFRLFIGTPGAQDARKLLNIDTTAGANKLGGFTIADFIDDVRASIIPSSLQVFVNGILMTPMIASGNFKMFGSADVDGGDATILDATKFTSGDFALYYATGSVYRMAFRFNLISTDVVTIKYNLYTA